MNENQVRLLEFHGERLNVKVSVYVHDRTGEFEVRIAKGKRTGAFDEAFSDLRRIERTDVRSSENVMDRGGL